jgi:hypothetical protein
MKGLNKHNEHDSMAQDIDIPFLNSYSIAFHRNFIRTVSFKNDKELQ